MKTAITVRDDTFERASRHAAGLGMSRSEFFARAAQRYVDELDAGSLTRHSDAALEQFYMPDDAATQAVATGHRLLAAVDDEW